DKRKIQTIDRLVEVVHKLFAVNRSRHQSCRGVIGRTESLAAYLTPICFCDEPRQVVYTFQSTQIRRICRALGEIREKIDQKDFKDGRS
ncbi:MAG TPA: hypothetical protein VG713_17360, partial [Pirellulales bacterium]|nr:hypothetical protein [Pirellulales bacterium]